jgi:hypothetical protein
MHWLERNAWWALLAFSAIGIVLGRRDLQAGAPDNALAVTGMTNDELAAQSGQAYALMQDQIREAGIQLVVIGALVGAIPLYGFRRRQRWSWWALWSFPVFAASEALLHLIDTSAGQRPPVEVFSGSIGAVIAAAILLVSARRFFGRTSGE